MDDMRNPDFHHQWCQDIINSQDLIRLSLPNRRPPPPADRILTNTLISETLNTERTIRGWMVFRSREVRPDTASPDFIVLLSLGAGLDGYKGIAHGGLLALIMDQVMNMCATLTFGPSSVTVESWQKFKRSIRIPRVVLCRAVCTRTDDERIILRGSIEDGMGPVCCEGGAVCALRKKATRPRV